MLTNATIMSLFSAFWCNSTSEVIQEKKEKQRHRHALGNTEISATATPFASIQVIGSRGTSTRRVTLYLLLLGHCVFVASGVDRVTYGSGFCRLN
ncbi:hypothetical protein V8C42DRAFT_317738 [Trichoderma barbatum]